MPTKRTVHIEPIEPAAERRNRLRIERLNTITETPINSFVKPFLDNLTNDLNTVIKGGLLKCHNLSYTETRNGNEANFLLFLTIINERTGYELKERLARVKLKARKFGGKVELEISTLQGFGIGKAHYDYFAKEILEKNGMLLLLTQ